MNHFYKRRNCWTYKELRYTWKEGSIAINLSDINDDVEMGKQQKGKK